MLRAVPAVAEEDWDRKIDNVATRGRVGSMAHEDRPAGRATH